MRTLARSSIGSALFAVGLATAVGAQDHSNGGAAGGADHATMAGEASGTHGDAHGAQGSPATEAHRAANLAMHATMDIEVSDDADIDFPRE